MAHPQSDQVYDKLIKHHHSRRNPKGLTTTREEITRTAPIVFFFLSKEYSTSIGLKGKNQLIGPGNNHAQFMLLAGYLCTQDIAQ